MHKLRSRTVQWFFETKISTSLWYRNTGVNIPTKEIKNFNQGIFAYLVNFVATKIKWEQNEAISTPGMSEANNWSYTNESYKNKGLFFFFLKEIQNPYDVQMFEMWLITSLDRYCLWLYKKGNNCNCFLSKNLTK